MLTALHVALLRTFQTSKQISDRSLPNHWTQPRFWFGQKVVLNERPDNIGTVTGCEFVDQVTADRWDTSHGWHYVITLDPSSPRYSLEPQSIQHETNLSRLTLL